MRPSSDSEKSETLNVVPYIYMPRPEKLTGGCLCGAIRYVVMFPKGSEWPPSSSGTCQCTMCRKFTGALIPHTFAVTRGQVEPPFESHPTYKLYKSSETGQRGFCGTCGSSLIFHFSKKPEDTEVHFGTLDEEVLVGTKVEGSEWRDEYGTHCEREGGYGEEWLKNDPYHIYAENSVPGVTELEGRKYLGYYTDGKPYTGTLSGFKHP